MVYGDAILVKEAASKVPRDKLTLGIRGCRAPHCIVQGDQSGKSSRTDRPGGGKTGRCLVRSLWHMDKCIGHVYLAVSKRTIYGKQSRKQSEGCIYRASLYNLSNAIIDCVLIHKVTSRSP